MARVVRSISVILAPTPSPGSRPPLFGAPAFVVIVPTTESDYSSRHSPPHGRPSSAAAMYSFPDGGGARCLVVLGGVLVIALADDNAALARQYTTRVRPSLIPLLLINLCSSLNAVITPKNSQVIKKRVERRSCATRKSENDGVEQIKLA